ncbi:MAG: adenosylhomocysteinase [Clostridiales bacterium]|jgi:adenosylhomocysteinase|nr:adenosylhomocysteinase [Clostridiales bacterium]MDO4825210.1 adenosylhomocysteinase [Bacillota bacterium]MEE1368217.1 adenosylhomocysteinase [Evtepia sp.]
MSIVKDMALAESGRRKIQWVRDFMPALAQIEARFEKEQPFRGLRVAVSVHLEAKTANLGYVLSKGGAQVSLTGSNPLSTQDDVAAGLASLGVETFGIHGASAEEYEAHLIETLKCRPHIVIDDGGDLIDLLGGKCKAYAGDLIGGCEETTTGILRLKAREKDGILPCPMVAVNDAKAKHYYDNKYGTGQSVWDGIMHTTNLVVAGKTVVVAGYGWCGKGVAMRAAGMGANVIVTEVDPFKALDATMNGFRVMTMDQAAPLGDVFVTVTGCKDVIVGRHFQAMKHNALLANAGHFDCEVNVAALRELAESSQLRRENIVGYTLPNGKTLNVLAEGRLVNLAAGNGHPAEIMDMSFAVQALAAEWLTKQTGLEKKVYAVPDAIDDEIGRAKLAALGLSIDSLTEEQEKYLTSWSV